MALTLSLSIFAFKNYRFVLFPDNNADIFFILVETDKGDSLDQTYAKVKSIVPYLDEIPKNCLKNYKIEIGHHHILGPDSSIESHTNWAVVSVFLFPAKQRSLTSEVIVNKLEDQFNHIKNNFDLLEIKKIRGGPPIGSPITIHLISDSFDLCVKYEKEILKFLRKIPGVYGLQSSYFGQENALKIILDNEKMKRYQVEPRSVVLSLKMAYNGIIPNSITLNGENIDFRIQLNDDQRKEEMTFKKIDIPNKKGKKILLSQFASFVPSKTSQIIRHYQCEKSIRILGKVDTKVITSLEVNRKVKKEYLSKIDREPSLKVVFGGEEKESLDSLRHFFMAFIIALICIYCILVIILDSFIQPILIIFIIPFSLLGVFIVFYCFDMPLSFLGMNGALAMIGVAINDALVMASYLNDAQRKNGSMNHSLIVNSAEVRLRPVFLTTLTTVIGSLPTIYGIGGYQPFLVPLLLPMSWGLFFCTLTTLILIPMAYSFYFQSHNNQDV